MPWVAERSTINQRVQIGAEATTALGTNVAAGKLLECFDFVFGINGDVNAYTPTGHKYATAQEENTEWLDITVGGNLDYNGIIYLLASAMGSASPVAHGASSTAKDWVFTPPVIGPSIVPQTYTLEQGDSIRAHKVNYALVTEFGYKGTRKDFSCSAKMIGQAIQDPITMTAGPAAVAISPVVAKGVNVYLDVSSAALGTTQLLRVLSVDYLMTSIYGPFYPLNRAQASWTAHVDLMPKSNIKLKVEADAAGMALLTYLQTGTTYWLRVQAQGVIIDNLQTLTIAGGATGGTFTLSYKGQTTAAITYSAALAAATVNTAFQLLSTVGANCIVTGSAGGPYIFTFSGPLASDMSAVSATNVSLSGGTPTIAVVAQAYAIFQHDCAIKVGKPTTFSDDQGIFAIEWDCTIVEDPTWAKAQVFTCTNPITAL